MSYVIVKSWKNKTFAEQAYIHPIYEATRWNCRSASHLYEESLDRRISAHTLIGWFNRRFRKTGPLKLTLSDIGAPGTKKFWKSIPKIWEKSFRKYVIHINVWKVAESCRLARLVTPTYTNQSCFSTAYEKHHVQDCNAIISKISKNNLSTIIRMVGHIMDVNHANSWRVLQQQLLHPYQTQTIHTYKYWEQTIPFRVLDFVMISWSLYWGISIA